MQTKQKNAFLIHLRRNLLILFFFAVLSIFSFYLIRVKLLQNMQELGTYLAHNYAAEEQNNITVYQTLIGLGTEYIDEQTSKGTDPEQIQVWIYDLFDNMSKMLGNQSIDLYAVVNDQIIAANPWAGVSDYDFKNTDWYQKVMSAQGKPIFTDCYQDAITGQLVVTIAQKAEHSNSILVFDVFLENFHTYQNPTTLPEDSSYFLCDRSGNPLYYKTELSKSYSEIQTYTQKLFCQIQQGNLSEYNSRITDFDGENRGVYYYQMSNGWISIITIPFDTILKDLNQFTVVFSLIFIVLLFMILFMALRDCHLNQRFERTRHTVQVLGDSYYAIYRVNYRLGVYEEIKGAPDIQKKLGKTGDYPSLLHEIKAVVDENTFQDFASSFSLENIRQLVSRQTHDFGGDYLRDFGDSRRWVNVRLLFDDSLLDTNEVVLCFQEVDHEKKQQLQQMQLLQSAMEAAQDSEKAKSVFFRSMSHDMRTPLNAVIGLSELAQQNIDDKEKVAGYIDKIIFSGKHLLELINDLLEISQLEQDKVSLNYSQVNLKQCIEDCYSVFHSLAKKEDKHFSILFDIQNDTVLCDPFRLQQILNNLISNAFKYSNTGASISITVRQCNQEQHTKYQIIVSDTGIGISQEFLPSIFESYTRETRFAPKNVTGTGLGMPIVKRLVRHMGGEITVESTLGKGSTFIVTLPFQTVQTDSELIAPPQEKPQFSLSGCQILVAEDNEINMEITTELLSMNGIQVTQAWNELEAVEKFSQSPCGHYDAILMDMLMPEMGGCDAAKQIRAMNRPDAAQIPIIAVTANAFAEDIAVTTEAGMNTHIAKPIDFPLLCQVLSEYIEAYRNHS